MSIPDGSAESAGDVPCEAAEDSARRAIPDHEHRVALDLERARKLGRRLLIEVEIDGTPWPRHGVELVFNRNLDGTLGPVSVRVSREASDEEVLADGGLVARCEQYNATLRKLRQLAAQLNEAMRDGRIALAPGSPIAYAHLELSRLDQLIERRQNITMSRGVVRLGTLRREIEFFERCDAHLAPIVHAATHVAARSSAAPSGNATPARRVRRWLRW